MTNRLTALAPLILFAALVRAQSRAPLEFDAAETQVSKPGNGQTVQFLPGGRVELRGITVKTLVALAWGIKEDMISGGPGWIASDRFDITAEAPSNGIIRASAGPMLSAENFRAMLRALLTERFRLATRTEKKVIPVYALSVAKGGPKLRVAADPSRPKGCQAPVCRNLSMTDFAATLGDLGGTGLDEPVVDLTELAGAYDFELNWTRGQADSLFAAMEKLGLRLSPTRHAMPAVVIDCVERLPVEDVLLHVATPAPSDTDVAALSAAIAAAQPAKETLRERYAFHEIYRDSRLDASGNLRSGASEEYEILPLNGRFIRRLVKRNGVALSAAQQKRENARAGRDFEKYQTAAPVTVRPPVPLAVLTAVFSNPRHVSLAGRDTLAIDFVPGQNAGRARFGEGMSGTIWIDETDRELVRFEGINREKSGVGFGRRLSRVVSTTDFAFRKFDATSTFLPDGGRDRLIE